MIPGGISFCAAVWRWCINCDAFDVKLDTIGSQKLNGDGMGSRALGSAACPEVRVDAMLCFELTGTRTRSVYNIMTAITLTRLQENTSNPQIAQS